METVAPDVGVVHVRTPTLPPATSTNCWLVGTDELTIVDPASPYEDEQARLFAEVEALLAGGRRVRRLFLTHHHQDHVSGATDLQARLRAAGVDVPVAAHPVTADLVAPRIRVDELVHDGDVVVDGVRAVHTPGHAPGHLVLSGAGWIVAGDMVAGVGTIVLDPSEGDLQDYLDSLERLRGLGADRLFPAHGPVMPHADAVLSFYVAHRHQRTDQVRGALVRLGASRPDELAPAVYPELDPRMLPVAAMQILTHLRWLGAHGLAREVGSGRWSA